MPPIKYSKKEIAELFKMIYEGRLTTQELPEDLYYAIAEHLKEALYEGFGGGLSDFGGKDLELLTELRENIYIFSAAKTYQEVRQMTDLLLGEDGIKTWKEFRDAATDIYEQYNVNWLRAEYDTAIGQSQNAVKWNQIQQNKDTLPYLEYVGVEDKKECDICLPLNGLTALADDPIWRKVYPSNHFLCRCLVLQKDKIDAKPMTPDQIDAMTGPVLEKMQPVFKMNPGIDGVIFNKDHPYFEVAAGDKGLAKRNFDLPIPEKDK